jgi:hypothetical protein
MLKSQIAVVIVADRPMQILEWVATLALADMSNHFASSNIDARGARKEHARSLQLSVSPDFQVMSP